MHYRIHRNIINGYQRGKLLQLPTLNVRYYSSDYKNIGTGVWASLIKIKNNYYPAATFAGNAITFKNNRKTIESHLLDKNVLPPIKKIQIIFIIKIREIMKFENINDLKLQINKDCINSKNILRKYVQRNY